MEGGLEQFSGIGLQTRIAGDHPASGGEPEEKGSVCGHFASEYLDAGQAGDELEVGEAGKEGPADFPDR